MAHPTLNAARTTGVGKGSARRRCYPGDRACSRAVNCLRQAAGGIVTREELMAWVYGDRRDGGPQSPGILSLIVCHLRRMGFPIVTHWGRGYRYQPRIWELT